MIILFFGEKIAQMCGFELPQAIKDQLSNKFAIFMVIWLIGNMIQGNLLSTGAFEVYLGEKKIWSSIEMQRLPTATDVLKALNENGIECVEQQSVPRR